MMSLLNDDSQAVHLPDEDLMKMAEEAYEEARANHAEAGEYQWIDPPDWLVEMSDRQGTTLEYDLEDGRRAIFFRNRFTTRLRVVDGGATLELVWFDPEGMTEERIAARIDVQTVFK